jgi:DNA-binding CsgD family transcriptional regulator
MTWPLTGRDEELRLLWATLNDDRYRGALIAGQAGVGKTRLASEVVSLATSRGWSVRRAAGTATAREIPLGALAEWADGPAGTPLAVAQHVIESMLAGTVDSAVVLFIDDAHLLDDLSAFVVHQIIQRRAARLILTMRTGRTAPDAVTTPWKDGDLRRFELQPLSRIESDGLLASTLGGPVSAKCAADVWRLTRGNALFLRHLVDQERDAGHLVQRRGRWEVVAEALISPSLRDLVRIQVGAVARPVLDVVDVVAISEPIDRRCLAELVDPEALEVAETRGLISASATGLVRVGHPLYGEVRLAECGPIRLRGLRGRVATVQARMSGDLVVDPLRHGLLWLDSDLTGDPNVFLAAGDAAQARLDCDLAQRFFEAAAEAGAGAAARLGQAYALLLLERADEAQHILDSVDADELPNSGFMSPAVLKAANLMWSLRRPAESERVIDDALRASTGTSAHNLKAFKAFQHIMAGRPAAIGPLLDTVDFDELDPRMRILGQCAWTFAYGELGRPTDAARWAEVGYRDVARTPEDSFQGTGLAEIHVFGMLAAGYLEQASVAAEAIASRCSALPGITSSMAAAIMGMARIGSGDLSGAVRVLRAADSHFESYGEIAGFYYRCRIVYTEALARTGDVDGAIAQLAATRASHHPSYVFVEPAYLLCAAWVAAARERLDEARELCCRAAAFARDHDLLAREVGCLQTATQLGDATVAGRLLALADLVEGPRVAVAARYATAFASGDGNELESVSNDFEAMGDRLAAMDAAGHAAAAHRRRGMRGSALTSAARAARLADDCGGATSPALTASRMSPPFTQREHEIALLLARGLSNRQIAAAMSLSVRTVEGHVYRAATKAGVATRSELSKLAGALQAT